MALEIIEGDVFNAVMDKRCILAHGVNAQGKMGSGVVAIVKKLYPNAFAAYYKKYKASKLILGSCHIHYSLHGVTVANCVTQENYGRDGKCYVDYDAVITSLEAVKKFAKEHNLSVHFPFIGGGLGGGDKQRLLSIFEAIFHDVEATLYINE